MPKLIIQFKLHTFDDTPDNQRGKKGAKTKRLPVKGSNMRGKHVLKV